MNRNADRWVDIEKYKEVAGEVCEGEKLQQSEERKLLKKYKKIGNNMINFM